jgi:hypothetical protein
MYELLPNPNLKKIGGPHGSPYYWKWLKTALLRDVAVTTLYASHGTKGN